MPSRHTYFIRQLMDLRLYLTGKLYLCFMRVVNFLCKNSQLIFWSGLFLSAIILFMPSFGSGGIRYIDKLVHFIMFGCLGLFGFIAFKNDNSVFVLLVLYMIIAEIIQELFIPGRGWDLFDLAAGFVGLLVTIWLTQYLRKNIKGNKIKLNNLKI